MPYPFLVDAHTRRRGNKAASQISVQFQKSRLQSCRFSSPSADVENRDNGSLLQGFANQVPWNPRVPQRSFKSQPGCGRSLDEASTPLPTSHPTAHTSARTTPLDLFYVWGCRMRFHFLKDSVVVCVCLFFKFKNPHLVEKA